MTFTATPLDSERRAYWSAQMDEAYAFMQAINAFPVHECGEPMVSLVDAAQTAGARVRFSAKPHVHGLPRLYWMRAGLLDDFLGCARAMNERGWEIMVEDGFRTVEMQKYLARQPYTFDVIVNRVIWECGGVVPDLNLVVRRMNALVAGAPKVGTHMSGSAIDISVYRLDTDEEIDRGGPYLEMSALTPMDSPFVSAAARANRMAITAIMARFGFVAYPWEFWHYNKGDAYDHYLNGSHQPARYGAVDVDPASGHVRAIDDPQRPLNAPEEIEAEIRRVLVGRANNSATD